MEAGPRDTAQGTEPVTVDSGEPEQDGVRLSPDGPDDTQGDTLHGGPGNDTFKTRDGEQDNIDCGPGSDTALLDFKDVIVDATAQNPNGSCEVVNRKAPRPREDKQENATPPEGR